MEAQAGLRVYWLQGNKYGYTTGETISDNIIEVKFDDGKIRGIRQAQLKKVEDKVLDFSSRFKRRDFSGYQKFRLFLTHSRIKGGLTNVIYSMKYGDVQFLPYQFKPVFKFIEANEQRLLIADEVGLGKTIESLYIWKELQARENASRLLIVCPAILRTKWKTDMENHFGIEAQIVDAKELHEYCSSACRINKSFSLITSLEGIRQKEIDEEKLADNMKKRDSVKLNRFFEDLFEDAEKKEVFDLVVFDEAAKLTNTGTANFATSQRICNISKNLLLLSATPISNKQTDLFSLLKLLSPSQYRNEEEFNRIYEQNKLVVKLASCFYHHPHNLEQAVNDANSLIESIKRTLAFGKDPFFSKLQKELVPCLSSDKKRRETYDQITERFFYSNVFSRSRKRDVLENVAVRHAQTTHFELSEIELGVYKRCTSDLEEMCIEEHDRVFAFGIMARQRELASSIPAALERWRTVGKTKESINIEDEFEDPQDQESTSIPSTALELRESDIEKLEECDTKYKAFKEKLQEEIAEGFKTEKTEKIVVFSFFRNTLEYLYRRLNSDDIIAIKIVGGMKQEEKDRNLAMFKEDPNISVLLSSEVGAEGLDMQFSNLEFNYDLPWNPMKLEQRIGRIDRIGQNSDVIRIVNMLCANTVEDRVLEKLYTKIGIFRESIGELDDILGKQTQEIEQSLLDSSLSDDDKEVKADEAINRYWNEIQSRINLEEAAGLSKAYSDSILEYVNAAERNSRYIRKEDLINYMYDFFTNYGNGSRFFKNEHYKDCWTLEMSNEDKFSLAEFLRSTGKFFENSNMDKLICTFPQGKKNISNRFINVDINHQIIKWIHETTEKKNRKCIP